MTNLELEKCITQYGRDIYSYCRFLTREKQEADELYQETFLKAIELRERIDIRENPKGYFLAVATRLWKDKKRKNVRRQRIAPDITPRQDYVEGAARESAAEPTASIPGNPEDIPESVVLREEKRVLVRRAVDNLSEKYRIVVLLFYMEELDISQIAKILKVPIGTVKSRLFQARKQLKQELESVYND